MKKIEWLKEDWKDSKKRSIIQLCLWFIFLIIVFAMVSNNRQTEVDNGNTNDETKDETTETIKSTKFTEVSTYEYAIEIEDDLYPFTVSGKYNGEEYTLIDGADKYTYKNGKWTIDDNFQVDNPIGLSLEKLNYNNLNDFISTPETKEDVTEDGITKRLYEITTTDFNYYYSDLGLFDTDDKITINVEASDNYITKVILDLTDSYQSKYVITISYKNYNN